MPLRLALMVAIGAALALGACSSDTKTVAAPAPPPMTDPDPDPDPTPDPAAPTLPDAAAAAFPARASITVDEVSDPPSESGVHADSLGNRFRDVRGYRFTCEGSGVCNWLVTKDDDGDLTIVTTGDVKPGEIPSVRRLETTGLERFLKVGDERWASFEIPAGGDRDRNLLNLACPAGGAACNVEIERRSSTVEGTTTHRYYLVSTGPAIVLSRAQEFYDGLAYFATTDDGVSGDPLELSMDLGSVIASFDVGVNGVRQTNDKGGTMAHLRAAPEGEGMAPQAAEWNTRSGSPLIMHLVDVDATPVYMTGRSGMFAGFAAGTPTTDTANTYGAAAAGERRVAFELKATGTAPTTPADAKWGALAWTVEIPEKTSGSVAFADALTRSPDSMWTTGFSDRVRLGGDSAGMDDDGTLHYQLFTDFDANKMVEPHSSFGDINAVGTFTGTVLVTGSGGEVPDAPPATQEIASGAGTTGTYNGVPGTFVCLGSSSPTCTITTTGTGQSLSGNNVTGVNFRPGAGVRVNQDTDWLAIGSWTVAMDNGATVFGAFFEHAGVGSQSHEGAHQQAQGTVTYDGIARGHYAEYNNGTREAGVFAATAEFEVDFGSNAQDGSGDGEIYGMLRGFSTTEHGMEMARDREAWEVDFASPGSAYALQFESGSDEGRFSIPVSGKWGAGVNDKLTGASHFKFFRGPDENTQIYSHPTAIAGTFAAGTDLVDAAATAAANEAKYRLTMVGAVGAKK